MLPGPGPAGGVAVAVAVAVCVCVRARGEHRATRGNFLMFAAAGIARRCNAGRCGGLVPGVLRACVRPLAYRVYQRQVDGPCRAADFRRLCCKLNVPARREEGRVWCVVDHDHVNMLFRSGAECHGWGPLQLHRPWWTPRSSSRCCDRGMASSRKHCGRGCGGHGCRDCCAHGSGLGHDVSGRGRGRGRRRCGCNRLLASPRLASPS